MYPPPQKKNKNLSIVVYYGKCQRLWKCDKGGRINTPKDKPILILEPVTYDLTW